jgi:general secretion pathway protein M
MKELFENISTRERLFLGVGGAFVVLFMFYFLIVAPVSKSFKKYRKEVPEKQGTLVWLQEAQREVARLTVSGSKEKNKAYSSPMITIEKTARQWKLDTSLKRVEPDGDQGIKVWMDDAIFDDLVLWLQLLQSDFQIVVSTINVERKTSPGYVDARITFAGVEQ